MNFTRFCFSILLITLMFGCATPPIKPVKIPVPAELREQQLKQLTSWKIKGKIAFITESERESANLYWQKAPENQRFNVTSTLGISVFSIQSTEEEHTILIDGKKYQGRDLDHLLAQVTGYQLPISALEMWLKGTRYQPQDQFTYDEQTKLPSELATDYLGHKWNVTYKNYGLQNNYALAHRLRIERDGLTVIIKINRWEVN